MRGRFIRYLLWFCLAVTLVFLPLLAWSSSVKAPYGVSDGYQLKRVIELLERSHLTDTPSKNPESWQVSPLVTEQITVPLESPLPSAP